MRTTCRLGKPGNKGVPDPTSSDFLLSDTKSLACTHLVDTWCNYRCIDSFLREEHIQNGYRKSSFSISSSAKSIWQLHNQTLDIWSHLIGFLVYVGISVDYFLHHSDGKVFSTDSLMFLLYVGGILACFLGSTAFHVFNNHSPRLHDFLLCVDQSAIVLVFGTTSLFLSYYGFYRFPQYQALSFARTCLLCSILFAVIFTPKLRRFRILALLLMFLSEGITVTWMAVVLDYWQLCQRFMITYIFYFIGVVFYISKFPEFKFSGRVDLWCKSHTLWHLMIVFGAVNLYPLALEVFEYHRRENLAK
eukprot:TRINITY_DN17154_c0_g1_i1.p1 TRINITY_DN17154_c0_g1~~TRINITY_DN17154_c0_g1_i1.p1  ORF type:complete len:304 (-),score=22.24 TRINITY_DN17154_c0_g1_i1:342-1253(-)